MDQLLTPDFALGSNDSAHAFMLHQILLVSNLQRSPTSMPKLGSTGTAAAYTNGSLTATTKTLPASVRPVSITVASIGELVYHHTFEALVAQILGNVPRCARRA